MTCDLRDFVNRLDALDSFSSLRQHRRRVLLIQGPEFIGKSCLVHRLRRECQDEGVRTALVDFRDELCAQQETEVVLRLRAELGGSFNQELAAAAASLQRQLAGSYTPALAAGGQAANPVPSVPGTTVGGDLRIEGGDFVGRDHIVLNNPRITVNPAGGTDQLQQELRTRRNVAFRQALANLLPDGRLFLFFDHYEEAGTSVAGWLDRQLLRLHLDGLPQFDNLWLIIAGRRVPLQEEVDRWRHVLVSTRLEPLGEEYIRSFWVEKRGLDPIHLPSIGPASGGRPGLLALMANNIADQLDRRR